MRHALQRTAQLGLLARDLAAVRSRPEGSRRDDARRRLVDRLGLLHGLPQKIGQILAFSEMEDSSPQFGRLTEGAPTLAAADAMDEVERQIGRPVSSLFREFSAIGISASIGQVHRAVLSDGRSVAVKIQHPGIAESVSFDLRALGWLSAPVGDLRRGFDMGAYRSAIGDSLERELDYLSEARSLERFSELARVFGGRLVTPELVPELCGPRILTTTWLDGVSLAEARHWEREERRSLSRTILDVFLHGVLDWGLLHADPNPGNYRFLRTEAGPCVGLLDFGCLAELTPAVRAGISGLIRDAVNGIASGRSVKLRLMQVGFASGALDAMEARMSAVSEILAEPFARPGAFDVRGWRLGRRLSEALGPDRMAFRTSGPAQILYFLRAFQGLLHHLSILDAPVDWTVSAGLGAAVGHDEPEGPQPASPNVSPRRALSSSLRISVVEDGESRASLTFDATAVDSLEELVPEDARGRLSARGIDLACISAAARAGSYSPGELFSLNEGSKSVRVWLE